MFPNSTYSVVSGGDPANITDLTHTDLLAFHKRNYHPSNARFFTYGSFDLEKTLERIDKVISGFEPVDGVQDIVDVKPFDGPKTVRLTCPPDPSILLHSRILTLVGDPTRQTKMCISFLTPHNTVLLPYEIFTNRITSNQWPSRSFPHS